MQVDKKIKILTLSDMPLGTSGVGLITRNVCTTLLDSGKYSILSLGGSINPPSMQPIRTEQYKEDWTIFPVKGMGNVDVVRSLIRTEKPDILWHMSDPRFWVWLWMIEQEIRPLMPIVYHAIWDNDPVPSYNKKYYDSVDEIWAISALSERVIRATGTKTEIRRLHHSIDPTVFKKRSKEDVLAFKERYFGKAFDKPIIFWNNRNARRKHSGTLLFWFKEFLDVVGRDKAVLVMHTDPKDVVNGLDLDAIVQELKLVNGEVKFSVGKLPPEQLALWYNAAICTVNISDAEGWGLSTHESLSCETPIICTMTGGLQEQVTDGECWFGIGLEPSSRMIVGSQETFIYEDRVNKQDFINALLKIYNMSSEERAALGAAGRQHVTTKFSHEDFQRRVLEFTQDVYDRHGSWETRKGYKSWRFAEVL
jgi:glycosyltransferase involved in cell wall biosynthesis